MPDEDREETEEQWPLLTPTAMDRTFNEIQRIIIEYICHAFVFPPLSWLRTHEGEWTKEDEQ